MDGIAQLCTLARAYIAAEKVETTTLSWRVFGDTKKLDALFSGKDIQVRRFEKALGWFDQNWPDGATWPKGVTRPSFQRLAVAL